MTHALVLYAHPCEESYASALHRATVDTLKGRGWTVDDCDLYAEGFDPILTAEERRGYHEVGPNRGPVEDYVKRIEAADALVLCFPVWNFGYPAILKGFFDRVFLPGVSFRLEDGQVRPNLTHIKKLAAVTTYGGTRVRAFMAGDPPRKMVERHLWHVTRPTTVKYLALYDMNRVTQAGLTANLDRVRKELETL
ncbi:flavodoxin family protein [Alphaproteobacteria bacterium GH1-50]|uniref:Flavodoxin family protein n=1 Tax=Kangsaoukella pontilimi TaxID=2691042 RepID=A0A7C9MLA8_9RHOB|nr:NAD(P)H-dependent oxidoreductase [Kangsaoukella pontilimi]MXQ09095.1 flavodoxin family protein [Kangsaoukella pontilimi]